MQWIDSTPQQEDAEEDEDSLMFYVGSLDNRPYEVQIGNGN